MARVFIPSDAYWPVISAASNAARVRAEWAEAWGRAGNLAFREWVPADLPLAASNTATATATVSVGDPPGPGSPLEARWTGWTAQVGPECEASAIDRALVRVCPSCHREVPGYRARCDACPDRPDPIWGMA